MAWIESHQKDQHDTRLNDLAAALGVTRPQAFGHLRFLEFFALDFAEDGNLAGFFSEQLAAAAEYKGDRDFAAALKIARFMDAAGVLVDFQARTEQLMQTRLQNRERKRRERAAAKAATTAVPTVTPTAPTTATPTDRPGLPNRQAPTETPKNVTRESRYNTTRPDPTEHKKTTVVAAGVVSKSGQQPGEEGWEWRAVRAVLLENLGWKDWQVSGFVTWARGRHGDPPHDITLYDLIGNCIFAKRQRKKDPLTYVRSCKREAWDTDQAEARKLIESAIARMMQPKVISHSTP